MDNVFHFLLGGANVYKIDLFEQSQVLYAFVITLLSSTGQGSGQIYGFRKFESG